MVLAGSSAPEADYGSIQQTIGFAQPGLTQLISVTIVDDSFTETSETFGAVLSNPVVQVGGVERSLSDDEAVRIQIQPSVASVEILDNDGRYTVTIDGKGHVNKGSTGLLRLQRL